MKSDPMNTYLENKNYFDTISNHASLISEKVSPADSEIYQNIIKENTNLLAIASVNFPPEFNHIPDASIAEIYSNSTLKILDWIDALEEKYELSINWH